MNIELQNILNLFYLENKNSLYNDKEIKSLCDKQNFFGFSKTPYGKIGFPNIYCRWWDGNIILFGFKEGVFLSNSRVYIINEKKSPLQQDRGIVAGYYLWDILKLDSKLHKLIELHLTDDLSKDLFEKLKKTLLEFSKKTEEENKLIEQNLQQSINSILKDLDKDSNGVVDILEGNEFNLILKKHQKIIIEKDKNYIQQFVKISNHLQTKKNNIQLIFDLIKYTSNEKELNEYSGILKNQIHNYNLILYSSLSMITSLIEDDIITFYEIHDSFDKLNIFNSNWENEISKKLSNIGDGMENLMYSIQDMGNKIVNEIGELTYVTKELNDSVTSQLIAIKSDIKFNNLLTGIQAYQLYKINKNTKSLKD